MRARFGFQFVRNGALSLRKVPVIAALCCLASLAVVQDPAPVPTDEQLVSTASSANAPTDHLGEKLADLPFTDLEGKAGRLSDFADRHALVIAIRDVDCPVSKLYGQRLSRLERKYEEQGVAFLFVNTGVHDTAEACAKEAARFGFRGRYARDHTGVFGTHHF
jgi:hypothetical protein